MCLARSRPTVVTSEKLVIDFPMDGAPSDGLLNDNHLGTALFRARCRCGRRPHHQSKFYTACSRTGAGGSSTVFAHELPTRSAGFDAENRLYLFALTVPRRGLALSIWSPASRAGKFQNLRKLAGRQCIDTVTSDGTPRSDC